MTEQDEKKWNDLDTALRKARKAVDDGVLLDSLATDLDFAIRLRKALYIQQAANQSSDEDGPPTA